jgi:putative restriction endonuclease
MRAIVPKAYREQCSLCRLRHAELLDAAHIIEHTHSDGVPTVQNGISLCKLHHAAFDALMVGITPDYRIRVRQDLLDEIDGPMLQHGLRGINSSKLILPRRRELWPRQEALEFRYERFLKAS